MKEDKFRVMDGVINYSYIHRSTYYIWIIFKTPIYNLFHEINALFILIGKPWSEEEHRSFLEGLEKLGKGDWKGIATKFVTSRKSSQVASHAQKYFNRINLTVSNKKRRRASVFDIYPTHIAVCVHTHHIMFNHNFPTCLTFFFSFRRINRHNVQNPIRQNKVSTL